VVSPAQAPHPVGRPLREDSPTPRPGGSGSLTPRHYEVLQAVADGRIRRDLLLGLYEPHLLNGRDVIWTLRGLVLRRLVQLQPIGPPRLTARGVDRR
jgi:hypothetical protein